MYINLLTFQIYNIYSKKIRIISIYKNKKMRLYLAIVQTSFFINHYTVGTEPFTWGQPANAFVPMATSSDILLI